MRFTLLLTRLDSVDCNLQEYYYSRIYNTHYGNSNCNFGFKSASCLFKFVQCYGFWSISTLLYAHFAQPQGNLCNELASSDLRVI